MESKKEQKRQRPSSAGHGNTFERTSRPITSSQSTFEMRKLQGVKLDKKLADAIDTYWDIFDVVQWSQEHLNYLNNYKAATTNKHVECIANISQVRSELNAATTDDEKQLLQAELTELLSATHEIRDYLEKCETLLTYARNKLKLAQSIEKNAAKDTRKQAFSEQKKE